MIRTVTLAILLIPLIGVAQDYQTVRSDFVHFFLDENGSDHGMRMDSAYVEGSDSVLMNYLTLRYPDYGVIDAFVPSWLGTKTVVRPNGENLFFNADGDTLHTETLAQLNDDWNLFSLDSASYLEATVTDISQTVILGVAVEVKTISLQRKDFLSNSLPHALNGKTIKISNSLGIVRGFDFHVFPDDTLQIEIAGMENQDVGIHRLTRDEVYDFQVGDEFHYESQERSGYSAPLILRKQIHRVLNVTNSPDLRIIEFETYWWIRDVIDYDPPVQYAIDWGHAPSHQKHVPLLNDNYTEAMPNEANEMFGGDSMYASSNFISFRLHDSGKESVTFNGYNNFSGWVINNDGLWEVAPSVSGWDYENANYAKGIGRTYWSNQQWDGYLEWEDFEEWLVYFKKGSEEWGTPFSMSLMLGQGEVYRNEGSIIYPNPVRVGQSVRIPDTLGASVKLFSVAGKRIDAYFDNGLLHTDQLRSGIYLLRVETEWGISTQKLVVTD